jgi:hypothetical protein
VSAGTSKWTITDGRGNAKGHGEKKGNERLKLFESPDHVVIVAEKPDQV